MLRSLSLSKRPARHALPLDKLGGRKFGDGKHWGCSRLISRPVAELRGC